MAAKVDLAWCWKTLVQEEPAEERIVIHKLSLVGWEEESGVLFEAGEMDADGWREYVQSVTSQAIDSLIKMDAYGIGGDEIFTLAKEIISKRFPIVEPVSIVSIRWHTPGFYDEYDEPDEFCEAVSLKDQQRQIDFNISKAREIAK